MNLKQSSDFVVGHLNLLRKCHSFRLDTWKLWTWGEHFIWILCLCFSFHISFLAMITKPDCTICSRPDSQKNHPQDKFSRQTLRGAISSEHLLQTGFTRSCSAARSTLYFQKYFPKHLCSRYCRRISHDFFNKCIFKSTTTQTNFTDNCSASCSWIHTENTVRCNWRFRPIDNSGNQVHTEHTARCNWKWWNQEITWIAFYTTKYQSTRDD